MVDNFITDGGFTYSTPSLAILMGLATKSVEGAIAGGIIGIAFSIGLGGLLGGGTETPKPKVFEDPTTPA